jgi:phage terminase large subunit-like protein
MDAEALRENPGLLRRTLTFDDPLRFATTYLAHHLRSPATGDQITFSEAHRDWCEHAKLWMAPPIGPMEERDAYIGPREIGKSTWHFLILPLWSAAFGYNRFTAAFAHSATQAESHLQTFKHELDTNELLRADFPDLCTPARRPRGTQVADNIGMLHTKAGFIFAARGIDSANLGMKVGELRPDLLILDDVEPDEANYSGLQMKKRKGTIIDAIFPLNINARVVIVGTVTMPGSIIHQLIQAGRGGTDPDLKWVSEQRINVHHYPAILTNDDGSERSLWPGRWSLDFLNSIRHTRSYAKNYANDPRGSDGGYWTSDDFSYNDVPGITRRLISVDPSVTTKKASDPSGVAVVAFSPALGKCLVEHSESVRLTGRALRDHILRLAEKFADDGKPVQLIYVETNQGGDLWKDDVFAGSPIRVRNVHQSIKKEVRAAQALAYYQRGRVEHVPGAVRTGEEQMTAFPNAPHDDEVDAIGAGVLRFLAPPPVKKSGISSTPYM